MINHKISSVFGVAQLGVYVIFFLVVVFVLYKVYL